MKSYLTCLPGQAQPLWQQRSWVKNDMKPLKYKNAYYKLVKKENLEKIKRIING